MYGEWQLKDQMILAWINNSLSPSVLTTVARWKTSHVSWMSLATGYASQSHTQIMQLRSELFHSKGYGLSITEFLDKINNIADNLALVGKHVADEDIIFAIMTNIGPTYEATISSA